jgi:hypothetical protein
MKIANFYLAKAGRYPILKECVAPSKGNDGCIFEKLSGWYRLYTLYFRPGVKSISEVLN